MLMGGGFCSSMKADLESSMEGSPSGPPPVMFSMSTSSSRRFTVIWQLRVVELNNWGSTYGEPARVETSHT